MVSIFLSVLGILNLLLLLFLIFRSSKKNSDVQTLCDSVEKNQERSERAVREEIAKNRQEVMLGSQQTREEFGQNMSALSHSLLSRMAEISTLNKNQLDIFSAQISALTKVNDEKLEKIREVVEARLKNIQEDNSQKLEKMRETVDEKLHSTLEKRLGESFQVVSGQLEKVHTSLGEVQSLASGVGDLKRVLSNVKTRGILGEAQLGSLLEEIFNPDQYEKNFATKLGSRDRVEFAIKFPGQDGKIAYLPIDAKFPMEDYEKLLIAQEQSNHVLIEEAGKALESRIKLEAKNIRDKYIDPPNTLDLAFLYLPAESLYAEVLRRPGLVGLLRRQYKITIAGPTNMCAILSAYRMGFQTLAIGKRANEVWNVLGSVKTEFNKFGDILDKTHKKLQEASDTIEDASRRSRAIEKRLNSVEAVPISVPQSQLLVENLDVDIK